ncbi:MAG: N-acetylmuramoyl-L-alanine amidase [Alphaproteobacteria bacterium]|nr:N-acetylmuramoyl-L-alanine amidase [Alphaproteobacteria bacterium]
MLVAYVRNWCIALLGLVLLVGLGSGTQAESARAESAVTQVRIGVHSKRVRVVLESTAKLDVSLFVLVRPYRIVLDMPEVAWHLPKGGDGKGKGFVASYRYGRFVPGRDRMVLDLKVPGIVAKSFQIPPQQGGMWRFVLDIERASAAEALARAGLSRQEKAAPRPEATAVARPSEKPRRARKRVVVIDPGHGGIDPGATGRVRKSVEKHLTLAMARRLEQELLKTGRYKVVLTRRRDVFIRLRGRIARARAAGADLFLSLHADSLDDHRVRGASVYTLSEKASDKEAEALAASANKSDLIAGVDLSHNSKQVTDILIDLAQRETMNHSVRFARLLVKEMQKSTRFLRKSHRFAGFAVLKAPDVPSVLVEMGYLSNALDEAQLNRPRYRARLAKAVTAAVDRYFNALKETAGR